jgi:hypothetical protein
MISASGDINYSGDISKIWYYQLLVAAGSKWIPVSGRWYQQGVASAQGVAAAQRSGSSSKEWHQQGIV